MIMVTNVGHWNKNPSMMRMKPSYCGWRTSAAAVCKRLFAQWFEGGQPEAFPILHTAAIPEDFVRRIADFQ